MSNAQPATGSQPDEIGDMIRSEIGSILLASTDPDALRTWLSVHLVSRLTLMVSCGSAVWTC